VLLAVVVSCAVSGMFSLSIYDQILVLKDFPYMPHLRTERLHAQKAEDIMRPTVDVIDAAREALAQEGGEDASGAAGAGDASPLRESSGSRRHAACVADEPPSGGEPARRSNPNPSPSPNPNPNPNQEASPLVARRTCCRRPTGSTRRAPLTACPAPH